MSWRCVVAAGRRLRRTGEVEGSVFNKTVALTPGSVIMASSRAGGAGGMADDVGDMRGRVQLMNDDRKALMESTQSIIKQNKELLKSVE